MKPDFTKAAKATRLPEGFYYPGDASDDETIYGVNRYHHATADVWAWVDDYKKKPGFPDNMAGDGDVLDAALRVYRPIWDHFNLDKLNSHEVAEEIFDAAFNMGNHRETKFIQMTCNALNYHRVSGEDERLFEDLEVDGEFGRKTFEGLFEIISRYERACFNQLNFFQGAWYGTMGYKNFKKRRFVKGLHKRVQVIRRGEA